MPEDVASDSCRGSTAGGLAWLTSRLPQFDGRVSRREPDYYGASFLVAQELGLSLAPLSRSSWFHGWQPTKLWEVDPGLDPRAVFGDRDPRGNNLVLTESQAGYMRSHGWSSVEACGAPFLWTTDSGVTREKGSLLVMPPHVTDMTEQDWCEQNYVDQVLEIAPEFGKVVACVSRPCVEKGYWTKSFEAAGIPWIVGASPRDRNALLRMRVVFDSFEFMTTPKLGSHIPYAAYCGCRVSVWGVDLPYKPEYFRKDRMRQRYPEGLALGLKESARERMRERYPMLFCEPGTSLSLRDWAAEELGERFKRSPEEMASLLGWRWTPPWDDDRTRRFLHSASCMMAKRLYLIEERLRKRAGKV